MENVYNRQKLMMTNPNYVEKKLKITQKQRKPRVKKKEKEKSGLTRKNGVQSSKKYSLKAL